MAGPDFGPPRRKPRDGFWLTLGLCVFLPASGLALRYWGRFIFAPDDSPLSPLIEVSDRSGRGQGPSGLSYVRGMPGAAPEPIAAMPAPAAQTPAPSSLDLIAKEPAGGSESQAQPAAPAAPVVPRLPPSRKDRQGYPKLKSTNGWRSWFTQPGDGIRTVFAPATSAPELPSAPPSALETRSSAAPAPDLAPAPTARPSAPKRQGYRPPPVVYSANSGWTGVGPGGPIGRQDAAAGARDTLGDGAAGRPDYTTFVGPPDKVPLANPEKPGATGACPQPSWWKNFYDGQCYQTRAACDAADYTHQGCAQAN